MLVDFTAFDPRARWHQVNESWLIPAADCQTDLRQIVEIGLAVPHSSLRIHDATAGREMGL